MLLAQMKTVSLEYLTEGQLTVSFVYKTLITYLCARLQQGALVLQCRQRPRSYIYGALVHLVNFKLHIASKRYQKESNKLQLATILELF
jgi:hypothetical protein